MTRESAQRLIDAELGRRARASPMMSAVGISVHMMSTGNGGFRGLLASARRSRWAAAAVVLGSAAVALAVIDAVLTVAVVNDHLHMQWGTPFDAFAAVGTVGALAVALWVFFHSERVRRSDERSEQAELITGWLIRHVTSVYEKNRFKKSDEPEEEDEVHHYIEVALSNASDVVVYDVLVVVTGQPVEPFQGRSDGRRVDTKAHAFVADTDRLARLRLAVLRNGQWKILVDLAHSSVMATDLDVFFRDHRGVYWRRSMRGGLTPLPISTAQAAADPDAVVRAAEKDLGYSETPFLTTDIAYLRPIDDEPR
ncbi:hypothetical protein ACXDF8_02715 [Mycolicibacterium sp. CBM1]